jgi:NAD(P)H-dependent nitrite reductase large subunit/NAD(P)H-dependent nitrite reductase small subunit
MIDSNNDSEPYDPPAKQTIVVIGNGMVGHRFCQRLIDMEESDLFEIVTFCEEPRVTYDRVGLTRFFDTRDPEKLMLTSEQWYHDNGITLYVGDKAIKIDRQKQLVLSSRGVEIYYDRVVLATGSSPFVPPVPGMDKEGVFVYRTIEDLQDLVEYSKGRKTAAVIGGGLLGLEAARAATDLGLKTDIVEFAPRLMPRQLDEAGSRHLVDKINALGLTVHLNHATSAVLGKGRVTGLQFVDNAAIDVDMVIVSAGIRPRDELARDCSLTVGQRGGVVVNDNLQSSDPNIYAIGEVAEHEGMVYGLVRPGYEMAEVAAKHLCGQDAEYHGSELSTKLKLMGVDVASFGVIDGHPGDVRSLVYEDSFAGVYRKLFFSEDATKLLGGILLGGVTDFHKLVQLHQSKAALEFTPQELMLGKQLSDSSSAEGEPDSSMVCLCNNVTKQDIKNAISMKNASSASDVKKCTSAGAGCGGCVPAVESIVNAHMAASGTVVSKSLCEHFEYSRQELFEISKIKGIKTFEKLLSECGSGAAVGCEVCKPTAASIFASLWNEHVLDHSPLLDTNDRFLANMQRGGLFSIVPRVPGGEITPEKLIVLGQVAKKYNLYTKITGGQRIDLFGAEGHQLPDIWEELVVAGFESGHAYGKSLRTVKSCVGTTWCRYGVQDSVGFAIRIEKRYRGIRSPHKLKGGVSGCTRECAEAQSKDFGLIATENGYNLFVGGNGGANPRHADLLATDLDEATATQYLDRFLMYYIQTAEKLTRTSIWLQSLDGGVDYLKKVVIEDSLGIATELEKQMQYLIDTYQCEWATVVNDPEKRKWFKQFINSDDNELGIEIITQRGQNRPADWRKNPLELPIVESIEIPDEMSWVTVGKTWDFPVDAGAVVKYGDVQLAIFQSVQGDQWYACQNMCPHKRSFVLSRGILGDKNGTAKIACPLHKKTFSLETGESMQQEDYSISVFDVRVVGDDVQLNLPREGNLEPSLATAANCSAACR